jgi:glycosyltransferase involved in cell wall biosynthesis
VTSDRRRRPRLVHVTTTDISLALLLGPQLRAFTDAGYDVIGASAPGPFVAQLDRIGITHRPLRHATRALAPHRDVAALVELRRIFKELRPDVVHTHNPKPGVYGRLAARSAGVPVIVNTVHGLYALPTDPWRKRAVVYGLERAMCACSHAELVQNREDLEVLARVGVPPGKLTLLGNGIDLDRFDAARIDGSRPAAIRRELGAGADDVLCGVVGRLVWEKGYAQVFEAAARLRTRAPDVRVVVAGPADPEKADAIDPADIETAARAAGVGFLGFREDVVDLYAAMDVYVLASRREGVSRSAMEATAMGVPVVAADVRGSREVVDDGSNGLLVAPGDAAALADAIEALARDPALRRQMGAAGVRKARGEFDQQRVIDTTLDVYERLLGSERSRQLAS